MSQIDQLEQQLSNAKELIEHRELALKLCKNREFRKLILEEYMVTETARMAQLGGDPALTPEQRADAVAMSQASGHLKRWLRVIQQMGDVAERDMPELEESLAEARREAELDDINDAAGGEAEETAGGLA